MKILLLQLKRIGDLVLTTPAVRCLREAFPQARLALVVDSSCASLVQAIAVDECWVYHKGDGLRGLVGRGSNAWLKNCLLGMGADWALDFTGTDRSAWLSAISFSQRRVTFRRFRTKPLRAFLYTDFVKSAVRERHTADHYTDLLAPLGIQRERVPLDLRLKAEDVEAARLLLARSGISDRYVAVHPGTARAEKYWLPERWAQLIDFLHAEYGLRCVLTGSRDVAEQNHLSKITALLQGDFIDISGKTDLAMLAAVIKDASLLCGVDTAAIHLADAVGTPSLALFGPTNPFHWCPRHTRSVVLRAQTNPPFTAEQNGGPMEEISVASAIQGVRELLRKDLNRDPLSHPN